MPRVRLFHWRAEEAKPLIALLRAAKFTVEYLGDQPGTFRSMRENPPDAAVIDLTRVPSHGRYVAAAIRLTKSTRHIPIVFVDGDPEKVERIRKEYPDALYCSRAKLAATLKGAKSLANPVKPAHSIAAPSDRTAAQKLGVKEGMRVTVLDPPPDYVKVLGALPEGASLEENPDEILPLTLWFVRDPDVYLAGLRNMRQRMAKTRLWIIYPKGQKTGLTQFVVRDSALAMGLVDYKICSVNETWTGLLFTRKK
jgi:CheY-like chemotaxis protein